MLLIIDLNELGLVRINLTQLKTAHPRSQGSDTSMLVSTGVEGLICVFWFVLKLT